MEPILKNSSLFSSIFFSLACLLTSSYANATVVEIRTNFGNFEVNLYDNEAPETVANFLSYVRAGAYANNTVHRSVDDFIVQMGGFQYASSFPPAPIAVGLPVINEPVLSNVRGTLSMAKLGGNANSATSQFFVNLSNNSGRPSNLDTQNGGFTVFGQVLDNGMQVVDQIASLQTFNFGGPFSELPLSGYSSTDVSNSILPDEDNLVIIEDIVIKDETVLSNPSLNPVRNTLLSPSLQQPDNSSSGGGSLGMLSILGLAFLASRRRMLSIKD